MSLRLYSHPTCLLHSNGEGHAESPQRLAVVLEALQQARLPGVDWQEAPLATRAQLRRVHADALLEQVLDVATPTHRQLDPDTAMNEHSAKAALHAAGAVCAAVDAVMQASATRAFCAVRPPGTPRHADPGDGLLPVQFDRRRRGACSGRAWAGAGGRGRFRRAPRQRHPGHLLERAARAVRLQPPARHLSGHRRRGRTRPRQYPQRTLASRQRRDPVSAAPGASACCPRSMRSSRNSSSSPPGSMRTGSIPSPG
jgi:hypothetical protein